MNPLVKVILALLAIVIAWSILKNLFGLLIGVALAAALWFGATKFLEKK